MSVSSSSSSSPHPRQQFDIDSQQASMHPSMASVRLELPPAERAGPVLDQPAVDARHVEHVPAVRQAPHLLPNLEILHNQQQHPRRTEEIFSTFASQHMQQFIFDV